MPPTRGVGFGDDVAGDGAKDEGGGFCRFKQSNNKQIKEEAQRHCDAICDLHVAIGGAVVEDASEGSEHVACLQEA